MCSQANAGKYQLQNEKTQGSLDKAQNEFDRLQEKFERLTNDSRRVSETEIALLNRFLICHSLLS